MLSVKVSREFLVQGTTNLDELTDALMEELVALEDITLTDSDISATLETGHVVMSVIAVAENFDQAVLRGDSAIRTAIHASGGHTSEWESPNFSIKRSEAELLPTA